ncbi:hypothetical protein [Providencia rustigianii]|uniref:hypothetical protein n=1 Tax=Providencia rustigianii TaxID=158850 RepID=UPI00223FBAA3|nr:hypothetical protein [Providencia rustigianii]
MQKNQTQSKTNNVDGSNKDAYSSSEPNLYYHPDTNELIFVPDDALELESRHLCTLVKNKHSRLAQIDNLLDSTSLKEREKNSDEFVNKLLNCHEEYNQAANELNKIVSTLTVIIDENEKEDKKNRSLLDSSAGSDNLNIVELLKVQASGGFKYRYVRSDQIDAKGKHEVHKLERSDISNEEKKKIINRVIETDTNGNQTEKLAVDTEQLKEALKKIEPAFKYQLFELEGDSGTLGEWAGSFQKWAEDVNKSLDSTPPTKTKYASFDKKAQIMRWSYGGDGNIEISNGSLGGNKDRKAQAKANIYGNFAFAEAKAEGRIHLPNRQGVQFLYPTRNPKSTTRVIGDFGALSYKEMMASMGAFRFDIALTLAGMLGASFGLQASVNLSTEGLRGSQSSTTDNNRIQLSDVKGSDITKSADALGLNSEASVFVGVKGGVELAGEFLWLSPELTPAQRKKYEQTDGFCSIAKVAAGSDFMLGIGATAQFAITYRKGTIYIIAHAELCWGPGAGGHLAFEVNMDKIMEEFMPCFVHMLRDIDYMKMLKIITKKDFLSICQLPILIAMGTGIAIYQGISDLTRYLENAWLNKANREKLMVAIIKNNGDDFKFTPPETKGAVIAALLEHEFWENHFYGQSHKLTSGEIDGTFSTRKRAILYILRWAQSQRDFDNIIQHLSTIPDGSKLSVPINTTYILSFLSLGEETKTHYTDRGKIYSRASRYAEIFGTLRDKLPNEKLAKQNNGTPFKEYITVSDVTSRTLWSRDGVNWKENLYGNS